MLIKSPMDSMRNWIKIFSTHNLWSKNGNSSLCISNKFVAQFWSDFSSLIYTPDFGCMSTAKMKWKRTWFYSKSVIQQQQQNCLTLSFPSDDPVLSGK
jgi:hypothetical protein